jgi:hypothetical protein
VAFAGFEDQSMIKRFSSAIGLAALLCAGGLASPALAMHWSIYAPDDPGNRYWIDTDSIHKQGDYIYFTWVILSPDGPPPTMTTAVNQWAINCATGASLELANGQWVAGPQFTDAAYLFKWVCPPQ